MGRHYDYNKFCDDTDTAIEELAVKYAAKQEAAEILDEFLLLTSVIVANTYRRLLDHAKNQETRELLAKVFFDDLKKKVLRILEYAEEVPAEVWLETIKKEDEEHGG